MGLLRSRLALRIYLVGLAQFAVVAAGFIALLEASRPPGGGPLEGEGRLLSRSFARVADDPAELEREVRRAELDLRASIAVVFPDGSTMTGRRGSGALRCSPLREGRPVEGGREVCVATPMAFPGGRAGHIELVIPARPPPVLMGPRVIALVLFVVGVSSWFLARSLTGPLRRLSEGARRFGEGNIAARVALERDDELGDVSRAFDEMAGRVADLLRAERELLANISHELRTPLARIRVALDLASEGDAAMAKESLADIAEDLDELERLITDVLTAARLGLEDGTSPGGAPPLRRALVDLRDLLGHAEARFRSAHPSRPLTVDIQGGLPHVFGDAVLLRRVIDNLLENAHKYTERPDEPITLAARLDGGSGVILEVIDKGIGINAADLARVFRPFFRADKSRTRATGGLGLGLALAKRIVEAHGGTIELTSALGEGTSARVRLPAEAGDEVEGAPPSE